MRKTKKLLCLFMAVVAMVIFAACGGSAKTNEGGSVSVSDTQEGTDIGSQSDGATNVQAEQTAKGVTLPDGYPEELVPVMEDAEAGWGMGSDGAFNLSYSTPSSADNVLEFYSTHFEKYDDAVKISDNNREINLEAEGKSINILIDDTGKTTSLRISISDAVSGENTDVNEAGNADSSSQGGAFPTDIVPIIDGAEIADQSSEVEENGTEYSATLQVKKPFGDVADFYKTAVEGMANADIQDGDTEFFANAEKDSSSIEIQITGDDTECMVLINIYPK